MIPRLAQNGFSREALNLFQSMKDYGAKPLYITILGVLFACSHAGLVEDGWYYFQLMKKIMGSIQEESIMVALLIYLEGLGSLIEQLS